MQVILGAPPGHTGGSALVTYLAPVFAVGYGTWLLGEELTARAVVGLVLVVGGAWLAGRRSKAAPGVPVTVPPQAGPVVPAARATS